MLFCVSSVFQLSRAVEVTADPLGPVPQSTTVQYRCIAFPHLPPSETMDVERTLNGMPLPTLPDPFTFQISVFTVPSTRSVTYTLTITAASFDRHSGEYGCRYKFSPESPANDGSNNRLTATALTSLDVIANIGEASLEKRRR